MARQTISLYGMDVGFKRNKVSRSALKSLKEGLNLSKLNPTIIPSDQYGVEVTTRGTFTGYVSSVYNSEFKSNKTYRVDGKTFRTSKTRLYFPNGESISIKEANRAIYKSKAYNAIHDIEKNKLAKSLGIKGNLKAVEFEVLGQKSLANPETLLHGVTNKNEFLSRSQNVKDAISKLPERREQFKENYLKAVGKEYGKGSKVYKELSGMNSDQFARWYSDPKNSEYNSIDYIYNEEDNEAFINGMESSIVDFLKGLKKTL